MNTLLISYDLGWPEFSTEYKKVSDYIKTLWTWARPLESFFFVVSSKTSGEIINELIKITDNNDKFLVMNVSWDYWVTYWISKEVTNWMSQNI